MKMSSQRKAMKDDENLDTEKIAEEYFMLP
jgi:hypothetical protein